MKTPECTHGPELMIANARSYKNPTWWHRNAPSTPIATTWLDKWLTHQLLDALGNPPVSFNLWGTGEIRSTNQRILARIIIRDRRALFQLVVNPLLHFGDLYSCGRVEIDGDLPACVDAIYRCLPESNENVLLALFKKIRHQNNTLTKSRRNIYHHYDIGNNFYTLWLDRAVMQYTCAYFPLPDMTLEQAQIAKMHHICRKLRLKSGQQVVEAGCGWGGFARFMAREYGVSVKAYNISHEQIVHARQKLREEELEGKIEYIEDDYRNIRGDFDVFVSVGMLEHIGIENYRLLGKVIDNALKEDGMGLIHTIGRNTPGRLNEWIEARIFPGARPPSLGQIMEIFEPCEFSVLDVENLRLHYAQTLQHWLARFEQNTGLIRNMYDEPFVRAWRLYLSGSKAAFTAGTMQLFQVLFARQRNNDIPHSRSHMYEIEHMD